MIAPPNANPNPTQKVEFSFSLKNNSAPNPTHNGAVFANKVGLVAPLSTTPVIHAAISAAKNTPAPIANPTPFLDILRFLFTESKNGHTTIKLAMLMR